MNTKKKQPQKVQSQPRKVRDLQTKKNPKGGTLLNHDGGGIYGPGGGSGIIGTGQGG